MVFSTQEFNNLKIHTQYSICEGAIKIEDLAEYCKDNKIKAVGIADSYNLCGALEFAEKISKVGTQPIIGTQINIIVLSIIMWTKVPCARSTLERVASCSPLVKSCARTPAPRRAFLRAVYSK